MNTFNRKSTRLKEYDYSTPGYYFITMCTYGKLKVLSEIVGAIHESPKIHLTKYGKIVDDVINNMPSHIGVRVDKYVIMPNHIHIILVIDGHENLRAIHESPLQTRSKIDKAVGYIKMNASKRIHQIAIDDKIWQRSFHDHIIRDESDYIEHLRYIEENPLKWQNDELYT